MENSEVKESFSKISGITIPTRELYFGGLFKAEGEISDEFLDEQTLGNHNYCFSNWKFTGHLNDPITLEEITEEASKLKAGEALGPDGITNTSIKLGFHSMQRYVFHLFNLCFAEHNEPRIWKLSYTKPLYKGKRSKTEPSSYRGISLLSCMYKLFTVSFTSVCKYGSSEIKFYHQINLVSAANCSQSTQFRT